MLAVETQTGTLEDTSRHAALSRYVRHNNVQEVFKQEVTVRENKTGNATGTYRKRDREQNREEDEDDEDDEDSAG